ncbi:MAG: AAA family ATPase [Crenarchaeota archaeon]|nr:AAA family ATPase [Thermoproteota archaeon]
MRKIAIYGKGGIGKSTISTNVAAALAEKGLKVMLIGCDPKTDCTRNLHGGRQIRPLLEYMRDLGLAEMDITEVVTGKQITIEGLVENNVIVRGYRDTICIEIGGPEPGIGCAGRGIILGIEILQKVGVFDTYSPDVVIFDVPGDIVCGGLAMPLRRGFADQVYVVTSSEYLPLHAANNLLKAIRRFASRGGSKLGGIIYNARGHIDRPEIVEEFARRVNTTVIYKIPKLPEIAEAESRARTVIECAPSSKAAQVFRELADTLLTNDRADIPRPLEIGELQELYVKYVGQLC